MRHSLLVSLATATLAAACGPAAAPVAATPAEPAVAAAAPATVAPAAADLASVGLDASAIDRSVDPCQDFYAYACGNWIKRTAIPGDEPGWYRSFDEIQKRNEADLKKILESAASRPSDDPLLRRLGAYYGACMDEAGVEAAGAAPLGGLLAKRDFKTLKDLAPLVGDLHRQGIWPFFGVTAEQDMKDATRVIGQIDQGGLGLPDRDDYLRQDAKSEEIRKLYVVHVGKMLELAGLPRADLHKAAADVMRIETALAKVSKTRTERRDPKSLYHKVDRAALQHLAPDLNWDAYFVALGRTDLVDLNLTSPDFLRGLDALLKKEAPRALANYLAWHIVRGMEKTLSKAFVDEAFRLEQALSGQAEQKPRWRRCVDATDEALGELLGQPFVAIRFGGESKHAAEQMVAAIRDAFGRGLAQLDWMDDATRAKARAKLEAMAFLIGYPAKWREYDFAIDPKTYAANALAARAFETRRSLNKIGKPLDRGEWQMSAPTVNAYYDPQKNHMVFPAGILQPPFYDVKAAIAVNMGGMGMVVGHELTHGFDDEGAQFDGKGNLENWWEPPVAKAFEARTGCVADQYGTYEPAPGLKVNGRLTLGENIADLGGLKLAFAAYRALRAGAKPVVAEGFSEDQQFFLAHAQVWCGKMRPEAERMQVQLNPHSPPKYRVNGPLSDLPAFSEAFQCKVGTPMHPEKACSVW